MKARFTDHGENLNPFMKDSQWDMLTAFGSNDSKTWMDEYKLVQRDEWSARKRRNANAKKMKEARL